MDTGQTAGLAVGIIAALLLLGWLGSCCWLKRDIIWLYLRGDALETQSVQDYSGRMVRRGSRFMYSVPRMRIALSLPSQQQQPEPPPPAAKVRVGLEETSVGSGFDTGGAPGILGAVASHVDMADVVARKRSLLESPRERTDCDPGDPGSARGGGEYAAIRARGVDSRGTTISATDEEAAAGSRDEETGQAKTDNDVSGDATTGKKLHQRRLLDESNVQVMDGSSRVDVMDASSVAFGAQRTRGGLGNATGDDVGVYDDSRGSDSASADGAGRVREPRQRLVVDDVDMAGGRRSQVGINEDDEKAGSFGARRARVLTAMDSSSSLSASSAVAAVAADSPGSGSIARPPAHKRASTASTRRIESVPVREHSAEIATAVGFAPARVRMENVVAATGAEVPPLPAGWFIAYDEEGDAFYYKADGTATWEVPTEPPLSTPAALASPSSFNAEQPAERQNV